METLVNTKGVVVAAFPVKAGERARVEIWVSSPTGDSTDSQIFHISCVNFEQAEAVASLWKEVWKLS